MDLIFTNATVEQTVLGEGHSLTLATPNRLLTNIYTNLSIAT